MAQSYLHSVTDALWDWKHVWTHIEEDEAILLLLDVSAFKPMSACSASGSTGQQAVKSLDYCAWAGLV